MKKSGMLLVLLLLLCQVFFNSNINSSVQNGSIECCQVPLEDRSCIGKCLATMFPHGYQAEGTICPLVGGISHDRLYCGVVDNHKFVFKFVPWVDDYIRQYTYSEMAAQHQLGPKILYNNEEDLLFVMEFVEGSLLSPSMLEDNVILHQLGQAVYDMHHADIANADAFDIFDRIDQMVLSHSGKKSESYIELIEYMPFIHSIQRVIEKRNIAHKPSHNDIHMLNVFYDNDKAVKFIDWGDAGFADPFHDLARVSLNFGLSKEEIDLFLTSYFKGYVADIDRAHFFLMQNVVMFAYVSFFLGLEAIDSGVKERVLTCFQKTLGLEISECGTPRDIAKDLLNVFKVRVHSIEFKQALKLVGQR